MRLSVRLLAIGTTAACAGQPAPTSSQADADAIRGTNQEWAAAIKAGDIEGELAPLTEDAMFLAPGEPAVSGLDAIRSWTHRNFDGVTFTALNVSADEVVVGGDVAFSRGVFDGTLEPEAGGAAMHIVTKYILIWRRQPDGSWKIARDIWNANPVS
jgi:uncharacterized protein (TIGR02246 family)